MPIYFDPRSGPEQIPANISASDLKRRQGISSERNIIRLSNEEGVRRTDQVDWDDGIYIDVPQYKRGVNLARLREHLEQLDVCYDQRYQIHAGDSGEYVMVRDFDLPSDYSPDRSNVLILLPGDYPETPPGLRPKQGVYLTTGLRRRGSRLGCANDYHSGCGCMDADTLRRMHKDGWAWWCFAKMTGWSPRRDGLVQVFVVLMETLQNPRG